MSRTTTTRVAPEKAVFRPVLSSFPYAGDLPEITMSKLTYAEQLKHPNWQRRRLERLQLANFACLECGDKETMLHVHHKKYVRGRMAWEYTDAELTVLCEHCHKNHHQARDAFENILRDLSVWEVGQLVALVEGFLYAAGHGCNDTSDHSINENPMIFAAGIVVNLAYQFGTTGKQAKWLTNACLEAVSEYLKHYPSHDITGVAEVSEIVTEMLETQKRFEASQIKGDTQQ